MWHQTFQGTKGEKLSIPGSQADSFTKYFQSFFSNCDSRVTHLSVSLTAKKISYLESITVTEVVHIWQHLDKKNTGPDNLSLIFLCFPSYVVPAICGIINISLNECIFPADWGRANICPIYKGKGNKKGVWLYRPISLVYIVSKVSERCVYNHIIPFLGDDIYALQHGFLKGRYADTQVTQFFHGIGSIIDDQGQVVVLYLDFSRFFMI